MRARFVLLFLCSAAASLIGCDSDRAPRAPVLAALSTDEIAVGHPLEFFGENFDAGATAIDVQLQGEYRTSDGDVVPVELAFAPHRMSDTRLVLDYFGPFDIPFAGGGTATGVFVGTATAVADGDERSEPLPVTLRVGPSIIVHELEPLGAACARPSERLLGAMPLHIETEVAGLDPVAVTYEIADEPGDSPARVIDGIVEGHRASAGEDGGLALASVPDGMSFYVARLTIRARDAAGDEAWASYLFGVHRPVEYVAAGPPEIAEIEPAIPVSGCMSGGESGRTVEYSEQQVDQRQRAISLEWNESFAEDAADGSSDASGIPVRISTSETGPLIEWRASAGGEWQAVAVSGMSEWGLRGAIGGEPIGPDLERWTVGGEQPADRPVRGGDEFWTLSSADVISPGPIEVAAGSFGVWWRQATRSARPGAVVAFNLCGEGGVVADATFTDYGWSTALAVGDACPPFPEPDLPEPRCSIAPCRQ